jgi:hypothetical protein
MTIRKRLSHYLTIAALLTFSLTATAQSTVSGQTLAGAWNSALTFNEGGAPFCAPAPGVFLETRPGSGTVIADSCYASEGAGYGSWVRTAHNQFAITFIGNSFGPDGTVATTYKVRGTVSLSPTLNSFSGPFQAQFFDLAGNLLGTVTGTVTSVRIVVEP